MLSNHLRWSIKRCCNVHLQGSKKNIFIFSTARSGSSWLMEMLSTQRHIKFVDEPLLMTQFNHSRFSPLPPSWEFLLPHPRRESMLKEYFEKLLHNRIGVGAPSPFSKFHSWVSRRIVFKILRCKDLMNWFENEFNAHIVYLVRHPLAASVSRVDYDRLMLFLKNDLFCDRYLTPELRTYCLSVAHNGTELQKKVLDWSIQNLPPMKFLDRRHWACVTYEQLVTDPISTINNLATLLDLTEPTKMIEHVGVPSGSVSFSDTTTQQYLAQAKGLEDRSYLLGKWRKQVSPADERQAIEILDRLGLDLYQYGDDYPTSKL